MYSVQEIADWFLNKESMSHKKLEKLLYLAYGYTFAILNRKLFDEQFYAQVHGPIVKPIYNQYQDYGLSEIGKINIKPKFDADTEDVLEQVWQVYGKYDGIELESIVRQTMPWQKARQGISNLDGRGYKISQQDIADYFSTKIV